MQLKYLSEIFQQIHGILKVVINYNDFIMKKKAFLLTNFFVELQKFEQKNEVGDAIASCKYIARSFNCNLINAY